MELFGKEHILYALSSAIVTAGLLLLFKKTLKSKKAKEATLKTIALITVFVHWSLMHYNFFKYGSSKAYDNILFPISPCNVAMYLLLISAFIKNKDGRLFRYLAVFAAYLGIAGGISGLIFPTYLEGKEVFWDWSLLKSLLSHSTMLLGCIYLFIGGFIETRYRNLLIFACGLVPCAASGLFFNWAFVASGLESPNAWFLDRPPVESVPFLRWYTILPIVFAITALLVALTIYLKNRRNKKIKEKN